MTSLGLLLGTTFEPRNIGLMFGFVVLPLTFLGGTYYQWTRLSPVQVDGIHWLQIIVLINPLIYVTEGMRAALTDASHMPLYVDLPGADRPSASASWRWGCATSAARCCYEPVGTARGFGSDVSVCSKRDRSGSKLGGSERRSPRCAASSSELKPGPIVAISNSTPLGSRK